MQARRWLPLLVFVVVAGCLAGGSKHYRAAEKAYAAGDLDAADKAYSEALAAEPNNQQYRGKQQAVRNEIAQREVAQAKEREKAGDWAAASAAWARAAERTPDQTEYAVRRELSSLKAKNLDADGWFDGVAQVVQQFPNDAIAQKTHAGARAAAYQHNLNLGEQYLSNGEGARAFGHFERAKTIDPSTPGMRADSVMKSEALAKAEQAEAKAATDPVAAYELYQEAYARMQLPEIKAQLNKLKSQASAVLGKLEAARSAADKGRWEDAVRLYEALIATPGAPASATDDLIRVRGELVNRDAEAGKQAADKDDQTRALKLLQQAAKNAALDKVARDTFLAGLDLAKGGAAGKGRETIDGSGAGGPLLDGGRAFVLSVARAQLAKAKSLLKKDQKQAMAIASDLAAFESELPALAELRRDAKSGSFNELIDEALRAAKAGNDSEAGTLLLAALNASAAPPQMRDPAVVAAEALKTRDYAEAERGFQTALVAAPRSKLAQRGLDIARIRRGEAEKSAVEVLTKGGGDDARAVAVLAASLSLEPGNAAARRGLEALAARVEKAKELSDAQAAELVRLGTELETSGAKGGLAEGATVLAAGDLAAAERNFIGSEKAAPSSVLAKAAVSLLKTKRMLVLRSGAKNATGDDGAKSLAELLKQNPNDPDAKAALNALLDKAEAAANEKNDAEAARLLGLAAVAISPAPGVKVALDKGQAGLTAGNMEDAEKAYADALDLEPENLVAKRGYTIAKNARVAMLGAALAQAKSGGAVDQLAEALKKTLSIDPNSPEAKKAFLELLEEAKRQGAAGNDAQAAQLLDAANVVSKPEAAKNAIGKANQLLRESKHADARGAYTEILDTADSQVAKAGQQIARERQMAVLLTTVALLENGQDLAKGAEAARTLRKLDPAQGKVKSAVDAALARAERAAANQDDASAARELEAVAMALDETTEMKAGLVKLAAGLHSEAEAEFGKSSTDLAKRSAALAKARRMGNLQAGLTAEGEAAAQAIRALLAADPNNAQAKKAFAAMLEKANKEARAGRFGEAASTLVYANIAAGAPEDLANATKVGTTHLSESRFAEAEASFLEAQEISRDSLVLKTAFGISKTARVAREQNAAAALKKPTEDPRPHAKILVTSLLVDPTSKVVASSLAELHKRAIVAMGKGSDLEAAQALEAAAVLENLADRQKGVEAAGAALAKSNHAEAEAAFAQVNQALEGGESKTAALGAKLVRQRRVSLLKGEFALAQKNKNVLEQARLANEILVLAPDDTQIKAATKGLGGALGADRLSAAKSHRQQGKLGVAFVYLERALANDPNNAEAQKEMDAVSAELKKKLDLIIVVDALQRKGIPASQCDRFDPLLQEELMTQASKEQSLGGYVLSPEWTKAVANKDSRAPEVSGNLSVTIKSCSINPGTGKLGMDWMVQSAGATVSKGDLVAELASGIIPIDEQDGQGNNARKALSKKAARAIIEKMMHAAEDTKKWSLAVAEAAMKKEDAVATADAYARMKLKDPAADPKRMQAVEAYLAAQFK